MNKCKRVRDLLALRPEEWHAVERRQIEAHLATCPDCAARAQAYAEQDCLISAAPRARLTSSQRDQLLSQIGRERRRQMIKMKMSTALSTVTAVAALFALTVGLYVLFGGSNGPTVGAPAAAQPTPTVGAPATVQPTPTSAALPEPKSPVFAGEIRYVGLAEGPFVPDGSGEAWQIQIPADVYFEFNWQMTAPASADWSVSVHLMDEAGELVKQSDVAVDWPAQPCSEGQDAECAATSTHSWAFPADFPPGLYTLTVGLYDPATGERAPVTNPPGVTYSVVLGQVSVARRPYPFKLSDDGVTFTQYFFSTSCNWLGIAGQVVDQQGNPVEGISVVLNGDGFQNVVTMSGDRPDYAPSGWEHFIGDEVKEDDFTIQLWHKGQPVSKPVLVHTRADCRENLAYLVFEEVGQDDVPPESLSGTQVTLHVFSGRPDPTWTLTTAQETELRRRLRDLSPTGQPFDENGRLGYSGFELSLPAAEDQPLQHVRVWKGVARVEAAGQVDQLADESRALERWLLDTAGGHVEADVVEMVRQELELDVSELPASLPPIHVVQAGETLLSIAAQFDVSVEALVAANRLDEPSVLGVGRVLVIPSGEGTTPPSDAPGQFQWPTQRRDISGWSFHDPGDPQHPGLDLAVEVGDSVLAVAGGEVIFAGWGEEYGYLVVVKHAGDWLSLYSHLDQVTVQLGQSVRSGEFVGRAGSTGMATGPHLHFELRYQGHPVDPLAYLPGDPAQPAFAIYLVKGEITAAEIQRRAPGELDLEDTPILTMDDILTYDWDVHEVTLTGAAYDRVAGLEVSTGSGRPFVVTVDGEPVYLGAFWTSASSASFDGIVIDVLAATAGRPLRIQLGYPGADFYTGEDLRDDARVFQVLQDAGKIPAPISHVVQPGDTLLGIAARYGVSVDALLAANEDSDAFLLQVGEKLLIPVGE